MKFTKGQAVRYIPTTARARPDAWKGILTFLRYEDEHGGCVISNSGLTELGMSEHDFNLEPVTENESN